MLVRIERILAVPREPTTLTVSPGFNFTLVPRLDVRVVYPIGPSIYSRREPSTYPSRNLIVHSLRLGRRVLSQGNAICRLPQFLCRTLPYGRSGFNILWLSLSSHRKQLGRSNT